MTTDGTTPLSEVKRHDCLGLPREVMGVAGEAAQTFAALRALARNTGQTFASVRVIADRACLPDRTVKRHLVKLRKVKAIKHKGRERRRTPTYCMDLWFLGTNDNAKFAILPRWAAWLLPTWAERAVFALVVSRDSLNEAICGDPDYSDSDLYGRLQYPVATMAKDSGLSRRAIISAKARLVDRGLLTIDPAMESHDELGRFRTLADTVALNHDFPVPNYLLDRGANVALNRSAEVAHCESNGSTHHSADMALEGCKSGPDPVQMWPTPGAKVALAVNGTLKGTSKSTLKRTVASATASKVFCEQEKTNAENKYAHIDIEQRRQELAVKLGLEFDENGDVVW